MRDDTTKMAPAEANAEFQKHENSRILGQQFLWATWRW